MTIEAPQDRGRAADPGRKLESWKEIAAYLGRDVTTVQRWERLEGLPVRRLQHGRGGSVYAYTLDLDAWRAQRERTAWQGAADPGDAPNPVPTRKLWPKLLIAAIGAAVVLGIALAWRRSLPQPAAGDVRDVVAVAAFAPLQPGESDPIGEQAADQIIRTLNQVSTVGVVPIPIPASELGRGLAEQLAAAAGSRRASLLITGAYTVTDERVELQARIINGSDGRLLHAPPPASVPRASPAASLEGFGGSIAGAVAMHVDEFFGGLDVISSPPSLEAYQAYRAGLEFFGRDEERARAHLQRSLDLEPTFWLPRALLLYAHLNSAEWEEQRASIADLMARRDRLWPPERLFIDFLQALVDRRHAEALRALGDVEKMVPGSWGVNYMLIFLSLALNRPRDVVDYYNLPHFAGASVPHHRVALWRIGAMTDALHLLGDHDAELKLARILHIRAPEDPQFLGIEVRALAAVRRLTEMNEVLDRNFSIAAQNGSAATLMNGTAVELRAHGQPEAAHAIVLRTVEWLTNRSSDTSNTPARRIELGTAWYLLNKWDEAARVFAELRDERPNEVDYWGYLGVIAGRKGDSGAAASISDRLRHLTDHTFGRQTWWRARIAAVLGQSREAVELLREAFAQGMEYSVDLHTCPDFDQLSRDEAFRQLMRSGN